MRMKKAFALVFLAWAAFSAAAMAGILEDRLAEAVRGNDVAAVRSLLARHANPNAPLPDKSTALTWAVDRQNGETVRLLLAAGAKADIADFQGATPLIVACQLGNPDIVIRLLKAGADARAARPDGVSAVALCAATSTPAALQAMITARANVNAADPEGVTPLMRAAARGNADNVAFLARHGANVNAVAAQGFTALFFAVRSRDTRAPMILLDSGADAKAVLPADGTSVAEAAVLVNNEAFARTLVARGVDLAKADNQGRQLIHVAAAGGYPELVKLLVSKGVDANVMSTPPAAAPPRRPAPVQAAGAAGAGAGAGGGGGGRGRGGLAVADGALKAPPVTLYPTPPLLFAAKAGAVDTMKALVGGGARTDLKASDGMTLTMAAAYSGNLAALQYALEINPDVTVTDIAGRGLMHMAVSNPDASEPEKIITYLVGKGVKLDAKDGRGRMPDDSVTDNVREFYLGLLKQRGIAPDRLGPADANAANAANQ
jgi:ankyrin repeat protein